MPQEARSDQSLVLKMTICTPTVFTVLFLDTLLRVILFGD